MSSKLCPQDLGTKEAEGLSLNTGATKAGSLGSWFTVQGRTGGGEGLRCRGVARVGVPALGWR